MLGLCVTNTYIFDMAVYIFQNSLFLQKIMIIKLLYQQQLGCGSNNREYYSFISSNATSVSYVSQIYYI